MATTQITPDNNAVLAEIFIAAPPDRVFQALTDPAQMPLWWGEKDMYRITECKNDLRPGGKWVSVGVGADGKSFQVDGEYIEIDRPRLLVSAGTQASLTCIIRRYASSLSRATFTDCNIAVRSASAPALW